VSNPGRDELIDARAARTWLAAEWDDGEREIETMAKAIEKLMDDRVRHLTALRQIAVMTETGIIARGGRDVHEIAVRALDDKQDESRT
jgi:hypothetical protein